MQRLPVPLKHQLWILLIGITFTVIAYQLLDLPIVYWAQTQHIPGLYTISRLSAPITIFVFLIYPILLIRFYLQKNTNHDKTLLAIANSVVITLFLKDVFKFIFGRYWPETWIYNNPSLLRDGAYGFNWFHGEVINAAFPSGHVAMTMAAMVVIAKVYPRLRWPAALIVVLMAFAQVGLSYHFLSDAIAGGLLGYLVATGTVEIMKVPRHYPIK